VGEKKAGKVFLIGAGPGDVELLTLKAVRAIAQSDVLLVDSLVNPDVLSYAKASARIIHVGKRGGQRSTDQTWIEQQMLDYALEGLVVARIKGGDPLIFGRGGEELAALEKAGLEFEVVSGITSATGVASSLGISLTHRDVSHQVVMVAGYAFGTENEPVLPPMAKFNGTLVIYMGLTSADSICKRLMNLGLPATTPVAAVQSGTTDKERFVLGEIGQVAAKLEEAALVSPVLIIIGKVVALSPHWKTREVKQNAVAPNARLAVALAGGSRQGGLR
jgi:uroporphyrin-III C-methyltransferase